MKDSLPSAHHQQSMITHLSKKILSFTAKSTHLGVKLLKARIPEQLTPVHKFTKIWRTHGTGEPAKENISDLSAGISTESKPNTMAVTIEQKIKRGKDLKTKNIKIITREDILSNRYDLDSIYGPSSTSPTTSLSEPRRSTTSVSMSSTKTKKKKSDIKRSVSFQQDHRRSLDQPRYLPHLTQENRSLSTAQLTTEREFQRRRAASPRYSDFNVLSRRSVRFQIKEENEEQEQIYGKGNTQDGFHSTMPYNLAQTQDDPGALYMNFSSLVKSTTRESEISDSELLYL